jgi:hypothetical protein
VPRAIASGRRPPRGTRLAIRLLVGPMDGPAKEPPMRITFQTTLAAIFLLPACGAYDLGGLGGGEGPSSEASALLPPFEVLFFPKPGDGPGQALCSTGTASFDRVAAHVDAQNAALEENLALFQALYASHPETTFGTATFEAEVDGVQLKVDVVTMAGQGSVYDGKLILEDGSEHAYLSGTILDDQSAGVLDITPPEGDALSFVWQRQGEDGLAVDHVEGAATATMLRDEEYVQIVAGETVAMWKRESGDGILVEGSSVMCWEGGELAGDMCDATCTEELVDDVTGHEFAVDDAGDGEMSAEDAQDLADEYGDGSSDDESSDEGDESDEESSDESSDESDESDEPSDEE